MLSLHVRGFRSLKDVQVDLQRDGKALPAVVLYGRNGAGKSNLLAAVDTFWRLLVAATTEPLEAWSAVQSQWPKEGDWSRRPIPFGVPKGLLGPDDFWMGSETQPVELTAVIELAPAALELRGRRVARVNVTLRVRQGVGPLQGTIVALEAQGDSPEAWGIYHDGTRRGNIHFPETPRPREWVFPELARPLAVLARRAWTMIRADRGVRSSPAPGGLTGPFNEEKAVALALQGRVAEAVYVAQNSPSEGLAQRLTRLSSLLSDEPLKRPRFRATLGDDGVVQLRERLSGEHPDHSVPLHLAGLGVEQVYAILGALYLSGASMAAIEEPEAHLHAPTMGRSLRQLLRAAMDRGDVQQLWIATHSSLFDLDPKGWFEVALDPDLGTRVTARDDMVGLDMEHLLEPGPALHALQDDLAHDGDRVVFRTARGEALTAQQMIQRLADRDEDAVEYVRGLAAASARRLARQARKPA